MGLIQFIMTLRNAQVSEIDPEPTPLGFRRAVTVDNTGAAGAQTDFPVRIELTSSNFDFSKTPGTNLRFTSDEEGETDLSYWIEKWDGDNELATIWVKVASLPSNTTTTVYMFYGEPGATNQSNGSNVFTFFDDFVGGATSQHLIGSDAGFATAFVPELRRLYFFGQDQQSSTGANLVQWLNIDTNEAGFVWPGLDTPVNAGCVIYHPVEHKIFVYGGRRCSDGVRIATIQSFDPFTETFDTLTETMPVAINSMDAIYYPSTEQIFIFGGRITNSNSDGIYIHDPDAGTLTTTTAELPTGCSAIGAVYNPDDGLVYLFGGTIGADADDNLDQILSYNPSTPNTNPVDTGQSLDEPTENQHGSYVNGAIYLFGGYRHTTTTYKDIIQKYVPATNTHSVLAGTMPHPDDDAKSFYDPITERIIISPWIHSSESTPNAFHKKIIVHRFNPATETVDTEPTIRTGPPSGWNSVGTHTGRVPYHVGSYMVLDDDSTSGNQIVRAEKILSSSLSSGIWMIEGRSDYALVSQGASQFALVETSTVITQIRMKAVSGDWETTSSGGTAHDIAAKATGWQILGTLIDFGSARHYGLVNRANRTSALTYRNTISSAINRIWINTTTANAEKFVFDWVILRKCALIEPSQTVGSETELI